MRVPGSPRPTGRTRSSSRRPPQPSGPLLATLRKTGDAERALRTAVRVYQLANGPRHPCLAEPLSALGAVRRLRGDLDEAERLHLRAVSLVGSP